MGAWLLTALFLLVACAGDDDTRPVAAQRELPFDQQTLTVATPGDVYITRERIVLGMWPDNANICETLVGLDENFKVTPLLATGWRHQGGNTFRFELRRGVKFHNGAPFDAEAVRFSLERVVEKGISLTTFLGPDSVKVVDEDTVDITPTQPNRRLPEQLAHPFFSIVATGTDPAKAPVCTGPFEFVSYSPNDRLVARRSEGYWGTKAKLKQLTFRFIPDVNTRRLALESGEVDAIYALPPQQAASVSSRGLAVAPAPPGAAIVISFNLNGARPYTQARDATVRRALALSLDANALATDLYAGNVEVLRTVSPPAILGPNASLVQGFAPDVSRAESLLDQAGWRKGADGIRAKGGQRLSLVAVAQFDMEAESLQLMQAQARRAGIELTVQHGPDAGAYSEKINAGAFDVDINYWNQNDGNPARIVSLFWYGKSGATRVKFTNPGAAFDRAVTEALQAPDTAAAARETAEAIKILVDGEVAAIPLTGFPQIFALKPTVAGFRPHPSVNHQSWTTVFRVG